MVSFNLKAKVILGLAIAAIAVGATFIVRADNIRKKNASDAKAFAAEEQLLNRAEQLDNQIDKQPGDSALKLVASDIKYQAGRAVLADPEGNNRTDYKLAWYCFRDSVKYNPKNAQANEEKRKVEDLCRQRGYSLPKS